MKAGVLEGDSDCINLVASSVYNSKPVRYLSMVCKDIKWKEVEKSVYNVNTGMTEMLKFLRMNHIYTYNHTMGDTDQAYQLRGSYRMDHWIRNRKWWWSLVFWGFGVFLANAYVMKKNHDPKVGVVEKDMISHHDFLVNVCLNWINPELYAQNHGDATVTDVQTVEAEAIDEFTISRRSKKSSLAAPSLSPLIVATPSTLITVDKKATRINDATLAPTSKTLGIQLNRGVDHLPEKPKRKKAICGLHEWFAIEKDTQKDMLHYSIFNVNLCTECYKLFHNIHDLVPIKQSFCNKYLK